jgi:glycosyltransferase involved in cell wall biosynthesis
MRAHVTQCLAKTQQAVRFLTDKGFSNIEYLPIGLDTQKFKEPIEINWKRKLGLSENVKILLYIGIIEPRRNVDFLIKVVHSLLKKEVVHLLIAGSGIDEQKCRILSKDLGVEHNIHFLGNISQAELPSLYKDADLFVFPSKYEIVGMVLMESLFFDLPIITIPTAGALDIVHKKCGRIMDNLNVNEWVEFIISYFKDPQKYGFKDYLVKVPFKRSWEMLGKSYAEFYRKVSGHVASDLRPSDLC